MKFNGNKLNGNFIQKFLSWCKVSYLLAKPAFQTVSDTISMLRSEWPHNPGNILNSKNKKNNFEL